ncbi:UNVERIFIED_ORG: cobalamin biosynthesis Mg chelatase CobN [Microbispora rosea subsp. rosea]
MHRKSRQLALAAIFASTLTAGGIALLGGTASAATSEPGGSVRATSYTTTISEPLLATEAVPMAGTVPIGVPSITVAEFPGMGAPMEQMAEEARQSIRDEASSATQQIMQEAASAQQRIEQMSQRAQQRVSEQAQSQSSASQSQSSSLPESAPGSALGSAPENVPPAISGPESVPPAGFLPKSGESSSSGACQ